MRGLAFLLFCLSVTSLAAPVPVQISEIAAAGHQGLRDEDGDSPDWIELRNVSDQAVNLEGWTLREEARQPVTWTLPSTNLSPGHFLLVFASGKDRRVPGRPLHANFRLPTAAGTLVLESRDGGQSRIEHYPAQLAGVSFGQSGSEIAPGLSSGNYLFPPTPGSTNSSAIWTGPLIEKLTRLRGPVSGDEPTAVTAKVRAGRDAIATVTLSYRVMFGAPVQLPMLDDGQHSDGAADDGLYGAVIPAKVAKPGQMIRYCVTAEDKAGRSSRWPLFVDRRDYSAYEGTVVADPAVQSRLPVLQLFSAKGTRSTGRSTGGETVVFFRGELYDRVLFRPHGQISRGFPKPSFNIDFPRDHTLRFNPDQPRVKRIKLLSNYADKSKIRNTLAYEMIAAAGCLGHLAYPVRVQLNGAFYSVAEVVENGDERWLERLGRDPQGALYKMNENLTVGRFADKKTRQYEPARDLAALAQALSGRRSGPARAAFAYEQIDIPQCISYFVAMALISSDDHGHKNYYLYRDSRGSGEWALLPWDVDLSWGRNWTGQYFNETIFVDNPLDLYRQGRHKAHNPLYDLFFQCPEFRQMYLRRLRTVMDELLQPPGTPARALIIEKRVRAFMDLLDPGDLKPSDASLDQAKGPTWGEPASMRQEAQRIIDEYLPGRRQFLFASGRATLFGDGIPSAQPPQVKLALAPCSTNVEPAQQFVQLLNTNEFAVDVSGWRLTGAGIEHRLRPGTVIPRGKSLFVVADVVGFRAQPPTSAEQPPFFVQGNWRGELKAGGADLKLIDRDGQSVSLFSPRR